MEHEKYLVRVVRPVFQTTYLEVEGRSEAEACSIAFSEAYRIPDENWRGRFNPEDYSFDIHGVRSGETPEGYAFSLVDFPQYSVLSTSETPSPTCNGYQPWMNYVHPLSVAAQMSQWMGQLEDRRGGLFEEAIENFEETLRKWRGADQKVVPLVPPEELRSKIELLETLLSATRLLSDVD
jgi:hypothetical protein